MFITRRVEFSASHVCRRTDWSEEENLKLYGEESNPAGHGHNFVVEITLEGQPDSQTGMVFDFKHLKEILQSEVVAPFDHRHLNLEVPPFDRLVPTPENIAIEIWRRLEERFKGSSARLYSVRVRESDDLWVDYFGERS